MLYAKDSFKLYPDQMLYFTGFCSIITVIKKIKGNAFIQFSGYLKNMDPGTR